jgi:hypothetical protein
MLKNRLYGLIFLFALALTAIILLGLPYSGFDWAEAQDPYEAPSAPKEPEFVYLGGVKFYRVKEVREPGSTFDVDGGGAGEINDDGSVSVADFCETIISFTPEEIEAAFEAYVEENGKLSAFDKVPAGDRELLSQSCGDNVVKVYYLFSRATDVFQINFWHGDLEDDSLMLFITQEGYIWVYRDRDRD